jgi:hypothetical protein
MLSFYYKVINMVDLHTKKKHGCTSNTKRNMAAYQIYNEHDWLM